MKKFLVRFLALGLCFVSLQKAGDAGDPKQVFLRGEALWREGRLKEAHHQFQKLADQLPFYGRAWFYLGLTADDWQTAKPLFEKALQQEPANAWMAYMAGTRMLAHSDLLTAGEREFAIREIQRSLAIHYPRHPSPYLEPALSFLWKNFSDFDLILKAAPRDYPSYKLLFSFVRKEGLWQYQDQVYRDFEAFAQQVYETECQRAEDYLAKGRPRRALQVFQKAFWMNKNLPRAKAGILSAEKALGLPPSKEEPTPYSYKDQLASREKIKIGLDLKPGPVTFRWAMQSLPDKKARHGFVVVRLDGRLMGTVSFAAPGWKLFEFETGTEGGRHDLEVYFPGESKEGEEARGPLIKLGPMKVVYPSHEIH